MWDAYPKALPFSTFLVYILFRSLSSLICVNGTLFSMYHQMHSLFNELGESHEQ